MGGACRARARTTPDPRMGVDRSGHPPQARRGSAGSRAEDWRGDPEDSRAPVLRASVGGGLLSVQDGPWREALRHLVLRRWDAAERIRAPGTAMVYGIGVAVSSDPAGDHLRARPSGCRRSVAGDEIQRRRHRDQGGGTLGTEPRDLDSMLSQDLMHDAAFPSSMAKPEIVVLIPESTRKARGGSSDAPEIDSIAGALPATIRAKLEGLREEVLHKSPKGSVRPGGLLPAYRRFQGNMYMSIPEEAWAQRAPNVEIVIASGLRGLVASRDTVPAYALSMAEPTPPFGKMNRWWHDRGLPQILAAYLDSIHPRLVVDLLSLEYRQSVVGYAADLKGIDVRTIDFPGMGRASQPLRGERIARILQSGTA